MITLEHLKKVRTEELSTLMFVYTHLHCFQRMRSVFTDHSLDKPSYVLVFQLLPSTYPLSLIIPEKHSTHQ